MLDILRFTVRNAAGSGWEHALKEALRQVDGGSYARTSCRFA